ncbi:YARHG domain-containing protein [Sporosarcina ureae]|uniref:YARHG domain-containing protein n=1 Tax=Sporosarcina ureae TaxID=1571 RepID=UPI0026ECF0C9|nr:YARHG domain-containing protein [Sporosarcina ureae]
MKKCPICNEMNDKQQEFCTNCKASLASRRLNKKRSIWKTPHYPIVLIVVVLVAIMGYYTIESKYGRHATTEKFITALIEQDRDTLKELIVPKDSRIAINADSVQALLTLVEKNPSIVQVVENHLHEKSEDGMFSIRAAGKRLGLFPRYTINPVGYIVKVQSIGDETVLSIHDAEMGYIKKRKEHAEFGPFMAGIYPIKMTTTLDDDTVREEIQANVFGAKQTVHLDFDSIKELAIAANTDVEKDNDLPVVQNDIVKEEPVETIIVKEIIKEVPADVPKDHFIISYSGDVYLDKSDLKGLSKDDLRLARNEIYARHGYVFESKELQNYFGSQSWYTPDPSFNGKMAEWEKHNVELIKSHE